MAALIRVVPAIGLLVLFFLFGVSGAAAESDFEYWGEYSLEGSITEKFSALVASKYRYNEDAKEHYYTSTEIELDYEATDRLEMDVGYKEVFRRKNSIWRQENRLYTQVALNGNLDGWKIKNRIRAERLEKEEETAHYRFRNKLTIKTPWQWTSREISPFVADEIFIEVDEGEGFNENRFYAGVGVKLIRALWLNLSYLYKIEAKNRQWSERVNAVVTELAAKF